MTSRTTAFMFGVRLHQVGSWEWVRAVCEGFFEDGRTHCVFTPNPEILLYARAHTDYATLLNEADLALPDGFGVALSYFLRGRRRIRRWPGIDVAEMILRLAADRGLCVMFLGGRGGIGERAATRWRAEIPGLHVITAADGVPFGEDGRAVHPGQAAEVEDRIRRTEPGVVLVALGHPKQERWIAQHRSSVPSARILMGVGGALDMWGRRFPRAPGWIRSLGLEWIWRLQQQPSRLPRILRATIEFPWRALTERRPSAGPDNDDLLH
jgi:N-acetylglucosaminyldiphosphoundecaprenol N-acetyl-beta-D-mannosaminyltransferase